MNKNNLVMSKDRRSFLRKTLGVSVAAAAVYFASGAMNVVKAASKKKVVSHVVNPGELDKYYGFWSSGQSGEVRVLAVPSMRELKLIPCFNYDCTNGWGITNYSKQILKGYTVGDTHHLHLSYNNGTYDGKFGFINDKSTGRVARVRLDVMETDAITKVPYAQGTHGLFTSRHKLDAVFCNSEFAIPLPNDGRDIENPDKYVALHTCIDAKTMKVRWQVMIDGNLDLCATDYQGKYSMGTCYNSEEGVLLEDMMSADRDHLTVFNLEKIEEAVNQGKGIKFKESDAPIIDGRGKNPYVLYIPVPKNPHGVNISPDGKYAICSGKLSPTASVISIEKIADAFAGKIAPKDCILAEPELGLGPLHTAFDGRGNCYTTLFLDSMVCMWNIDKAIKGDKDYLIQKLDVHYQPGHINASMSETKDADGNYVVSLNKFSKDRFLPVGPSYPDNDQLIGISEGRMKLLHDGPVAPEPHDALIVNRSLIKTVKIWNINDRKFAYERKLVQDLGLEFGANKIVRKDDKVFAIMSSIAPNYGLKVIDVNLGDEVTIVQTNLDKVEDLTHGFCLSEHNLNFGVSPGETASVTFRATRRGVFWYYCTWFCHALHLEMRGRLLVH
ncbi:TAT-dependent nitrous-oxide reductase [Candidatus Azoamicus ciliaticola]|uniref:Nitrous-oxide reductase n=1 Tax=Candidatus Azoamicus ciliaticola TaxID=2652803 RepID=A0A6J5JXA8_9GAMM|nr:TAT-dependent nitrous-oxide reductase [Candidatus Azoamicus ciliaticola]CAB3976456.1 Nitrous-oxide reductase [Candidatus Azoamicus ciliaticola]